MSVSDKREELEDLAHDGLVNLIGILISIKKDVKFIEDGYLEGLAGACAISEYGFIEFHKEYVKQ